jgi:hypothetical protein
MRSFSFFPLKWCLLHILAHLVQSSILWLTDWLSFCSSFWSIGHPWNSSIWSCWLPVFLLPNVNIFPIWFYFTSVSLIIDLKVCRLLAHMSDLGDGAATYSFQASWFFIGFTPLTLEGPPHCKAAGLSWLPQERMGCHFHHPRCTKNLLLHWEHHSGLCCNPSKRPSHGNISWSQLNQSFFKEMLLLCHSSICPGLWQAEPGLLLLDPGWLGFFHSMPFQIMPSACTFPSHSVWNSASLQVMSSHF